MLELTEVGYGVSGIPQTIEEAEENSITYVALGVLQEQSISPRESLNKQISETEERQRLNYIGKDLAALGSMGLTGVSSAALAVACSVPVSIPLLGILTYVMSIGGVSAGTVGTIFSLDRGDIENEESDRKVLSLRRALWNLENPLFKEFCESKNFENLDELLTKIEFHKYIWVSIRLEKLMQETPEGNKNDIIYLKKVLKLREKQEKLLAYF